MAGAAPSVSDIRNTPEPLWGLTVTGSGHPTAGSAVRAGQWSLRKGLPSHHSQNSLGIAWLGRAELARTESIPVGRGGCGSLLLTHLAKGWNCIWEPRFEGNTSLKHGRTKAFPSSQGTPAGKHLQQQEVPGPCKEGRRT